MNLVLDVLPFVKQYCDNNTWTDQELVRIMQKCIDEGCFLFTQDKGKIVAVGFGLLDKNICFVLGLVIHPKYREYLKTYIQEFKQKYPGFVMKAKRHGRIKEINYERILQKLS